MARVLVIDHSPLCRQILSAALARDLDLEIVGTAQDPFVARDLIVELCPDVITLEVDLPRMDGIAFLRTLMAHHPVPAVVVTSLLRGGGLARAALQAGAVAVLHKPRDVSSLKHLCPRVAQEIRAAARLGVPAPAQPSQRASKALAPCEPGDPIVGIGVGWGGAPALEYLLRSLPADAPGVVVAQQLPDPYIDEIVCRVSRDAAIEVRMAEDGDRMAPGLVLISRADAHIVVRAVPDGYTVGRVSGPPVSHQRPSIDMLFLSLAAAAAPRCTGVMLAGLGADGMQGLAELRRAGGQTLANDEPFLVGTLRTAAEQGLLSSVVAIEHLPEAMLRWHATGGAALSRRLMD